MQIYWRTLVVILTRSQITAPDGCAPEVSAILYYSAGTSLGREGVTMRIMVC